MKSLFIIKKSFRLLYLYIVTYNKVATYDFISNASLKKATRNKPAIAFLNKLLIKLSYKLFLKLFIRVKVSFY